MSLASRFVKWLNTPPDEFDWFVVIRESWQVFRHIGRHEPIPTYGTWITVKDNPPSGQDEVLTWDGKDVESFLPDTLQDGENEPFNTGKERCERFGITHWMPYPKPPTASVSSEPE